MGEGWQVGGRLSSGVHGGQKFGTKEINGLVVGVQDSSIFSRRWAVETSRHIWPTGAGH